MVKTSVLHDALKSINNAEKAGKRQVMIRPASKVITKFLQVMQRHGKLQVPADIGRLEDGSIHIRHDNWTTVSTTNDPSLLSCR